MFSLLLKDLISDFILLFVLVNCLGGLRMPENSVCRLTDRVRHYLNSVYLAVKCQSNKIYTYFKMIYWLTHMHIQDLMACIFYRLLYVFILFIYFIYFFFLFYLFIFFFASWYSKVIVIEIKLMNYFSLVPKFQN